MTQMTYGYSRDDAEGKFLSHYVDSKLLPSNPFQVLDSDGVGLLIEWAVTRARLVKPGLKKTGVCGEHGGDRESIFFSAMWRAWIMSAAPRTACRSPESLRHRRSWRSERQSRPDWKRIKLLSERPNLFFQCGCCRLSRPNPSRILAFFCPKHYMINGQLCLREGTAIELTPRQMEIVELVKRHAPVTGEQIAEFLGLSRPTIRSDLAVLVMLGYIDAKPKVGYFLGKAVASRGQRLDALRELKVKDYQSMPVVIRETATVNDAVVALFS